MNDLKFYSMSLKIEFCQSGSVLDLKARYQEVLSERLSFSRYKVYDRKGENFVTILQRTKGGVRYKVTLTEKEVKFYALKVSNVQETKIINFFIKMLRILFELKDDCQVEEINIKNIVFTKYLLLNDKNRQIAKDIKLNTQIKAENGVGLSVKQNYDNDNELLFNSYFIHSKIYKTFPIGLEDNVKKLYNIQM